MNDLEQIRQQIEERKKEWSDRNIEAVKDRDQLAAACTISVFLELDLILSFFPPQETPPVTS
jgi:hypothetical protein